MDRESFRSLVGADTVIPMTKGSIGRAGTAWPAQMPDDTGSGEIRQAGSGLGLRPDFVSRHLPDKPIASARLCLTFRGLPAPGVGASPMPRSSCGGHLQRGPGRAGCFGMFEGKTMSIPTSSSPGLTRGSSQPRHPLQVRLDGRIKSGHDDGEASDDIARECSPSPSHQAERTRTRRPGPTAALPALCAPAARCYSGAIRGRPRGHAHPSRSFKCLKSK